jgi:hypothetical protein
MKKLLFWMVLIVGIVALIGSCAKKDDSTATATTATTLSAPSGVSATLGWHQVAVDWTAVSGASSYTVYWDNATGVSSSSTAITGITDDNYTHSSLDNGTTYYYKVATVDSSGTGSLSSEVSATPRGVKTVAEACTAVSLTETPSGDWDGIKDKDNVSGSFYFSYRDETHSNGCTNNTTFVGTTLAGSIPSGTLGYKKIITITSSTSFTKADHWFSDTDCTVGTGWFATGYDNVSVGDNITIAGWPDAGEAAQFVPYATKFDNYTAENYCMLAETDAIKSFISSLYYQTVTVGTGHSISESSTKSAIMVYLDNVSGSTKNWLNFKSHDNTTTPDNWTTQGGHILYNL